MMPLTQNSLTAQSIDAKIARRQQRYASTYNISYVHQAPPSPALLSDVRRQGPAAAAPAPAPSRVGELLAARHEVPTTRSLSEILRDAEADPELQGEGFSQASRIPQRGPSQLRFAFGPGAQRRLRHALLGGAAAAILCGAASLTYYAWGSLRAAGGAAGTLFADGHSLPALTPVSPQTQPKPNLGKEQAMQPMAEHAAAAPSGQDAAPELLEVRPALQPTAPLPLLPPAADAKDRTTLAMPAPADTVAAVPVPVAPSVFAELAAPAPAETAPVPQPKPAGTASPGAAPSGPAAAAEAMPTLLQAAALDVPSVVAAPAPKPAEAVALPAPAPVPVVTVTARSAPGHGGTPAVAGQPVGATAGAPTPAIKPAEAAALDSRPPGSVVTSGPPPPAGPMAQPDTPAEAAALPPGFTAQQMSSTLALVNQMALLVHDMHDENVKYRADVIKLTGTVQAKASDFEKRLRLAEARSSIAAAIDTGREPALAPGPAVSDPGSAGGEARSAGRAAALPRSVRDYRIRRASYDYAELVDPNAPLDQQVPLEVVVGDRVPGVGRVKAITVLGGAWVVRTDHGIIQ